MILENKFNFLKNFLLGIIFLLFPIFSLALDVPTLNSYVTDNAGLLTNDQKNKLEEELKNLDTQTTNQIVILTINNLDGDTIENFSIEVAEKNKIGTNEKDNGVLLLISKEDRKVRIEVGSGLEEFLTDAKSSYIIRHYITPEFKNNKYYEGINNGIEEIKKTISDNNYLNEEIKKDNTISENDLENLSVIFNILFTFIGIAAFIIIANKRSKQGKGNFWTWILFDQIFFHNNRNNRGGGFGGFNGFGRGGFGGGGGSFGGGGGSGSW